MPTASSTWVRRQAISQNRTQTRPQVAAIGYFWSYYTSLHFTVSGLRFAASADLSLITIIKGLGVIVIAEAFREGARLQEDQSLTI